MGRKSNEMHIQKPSIFNEIYMYIDVLILRSNSVRSVKLLSNQIIYLVRNWY